MSTGSYLYVHDWLDASGRIKRRVRRMHHTPKLMLPIVISESEVYTHDAEYTSFNRCVILMEMSAHCSCRQSSWAGRS